MISAFNLRRCSAAAAQRGGNNKQRGRGCGGGGGGGGWGRRGGGRGVGINNLIHYLLCKAHQRSYTMATIELLIAFLCLPSRRKCPCTAVARPPAAGWEGKGSGGQETWRRQREREREQSRVECLPPRSNYNAAI